MIKQSNRHWKCRCVTMTTLNLVFKPINLGQHADLCLQFIADTHLCSYGTLDDFLEDGRTPQRFLDRIAAKLAEDTESCLHVWQGDSIVGQINFGMFVDPAIGYLSFFYVAPERRGAGVAAEIDAFVTRRFQKRGYKTARLSVTAFNERAIRFYRKHGWRDLGPREENPATHNMEKTVG